MEGFTALTIAVELALVASISTSPAHLLTKTDLFMAQTSKKTLKQLQSTYHSLISSCQYHSETLFLFVKSDLKTVLLPWVLFGLAHALSGKLFNLSNQSTLSILSRSPLVLFWVLINLLPFCIGNQRPEQAIKEDSVNKSWRPIAAGRITSSQAGKLMIAAYFFSYIISCVIGGNKQCLALAALGYAYNSLGGADKSFVSRNLLNGLGFVAFGSGAMEVAAGQEVICTSALTNWFALIVLIITCGIQVMDMYDQEGDAMTGRSTLPLVIGDLAARWSIVLTTLAWSIICPWYWSAGWIAYAMVLAGGVITAKRTLKKRSVQDDKKTAKVWNLWLVAIYCLPLMKTCGL